MSRFQTILYEKKNNVVWITLNRPEKLNAQNSTLRAELSQALEDSRDDESVTVIVITGAGDRAFSAGADIEGLLDSTPIRALETHVKAARPRVLIREMPKPVIALVNGLAVGAGLELAMTCDIVIASDNAQFGVPEIKVGLIPGGSGTQILPRLIGEKRAKELIFTGQSISANTAYQLGMVNKVVPPEKLREAGEEFINELLKRSPVMLKLAKLAVNKSLEVGLSAGIAWEEAFWSLCFSTEDQKEGAKAFLEKRKPVYKGK